MFGSIIPYIYRVSERDVQVCIDYARAAQYSSKACGPPIAHVQGQLLPFEHPRAAFAANAVLEAFTSSVTGDLP
jgi:hypothetical protein